MFSVLYHIQAVDPKAHLFEVVLTLQNPDPEGQEFSLPAWIPGSYLIRDFSRNIISLKGECEGSPVSIIKRDKHTWVAASTNGVLRVIYKVYAWDLSVRGAYLDGNHAFFNGTSVFLCPIGHEYEPVKIILEKPFNSSSWKVATALRPFEVDNSGYGVYVADNYDELIDHPVEMGHFTRIDFMACNIRHEVILTGQHRANTEKFINDITRICEHHIRFFGEPPLMDHYVFLMQVTGNGYGGLEHRSSSALHISRDDLPVVNEVGIKKGYADLLGLISHEYFHTWNVKRIKPKVFSPYNLYSENYTRELWAYEGITSYYDDLALLRCKLISLEAWCEILTRTINRVQSGSGRFNQSVSDASFDAWIKFYRQDENAPNAQVNYYTKGALIAFALDMTIRLETNGNKSLDNLMLKLWQDYGLVNHPLDEGEIELLASQICGKDLSVFFNKYLHGTEDIPLASLSKDFGFSLREVPAINSFLGVLFEGGSLKIATVFLGSAAYEGGLAAGDEIISVNNLRLPVMNFSKHIEGYPLGSDITIHAFRRDELMVFNVKLKPAPYSTWIFGIDDEAADDALIRQSVWANKK